jgi:hypothetical protein
MCGDLDEEEADDQIEEKLYARFLANARELLKDSGQSSPETPADLASYMEKLFVDALSRSVRDGEGAGANRYERLAVQPVVFARLAGLIAGHLALGEDPLRKVIEALMLGYAEAQTLDRAHAAHGHHHGDVLVHDHHH